MKHYQHTFGRQQVHDLMERDRRARQMPKEESPLAALVGAFSLVMFLYSLTLVAYVL